MTDKRWNDDVSYVFFTHRILLTIYGLWPLQTKTVFTRIRWGFSFILVFTIPIYSILDSFWSEHDATSSIEGVLYSVSTVTGVAKSLCLVSKQKKLSINIRAAIDDWLSVKNEENKKIMMKYATKARKLTFMLLYSLVVVLGLYILAVVLKTLMALKDASLANANVTNWAFLVPCAILSSSINSQQYAAALAVQIAQIIALSTLLCISDTFFFNITSHLAGQLEILKNKFKNFTREPDTEANYRKEFVSLINRHNELIDLYQNLEDSFHIFILAQIVVTTIVLALMGLHINIYVKEKNQVETIKCVLTFNWLFLQSLVFTFSGEYLQKQSEEIFHVLYTTSWFTLPLGVMKDLNFAMMKLSTPFRLTGGKFFYVNRETTMYILRSAASYLSVLRIALFKKKH